MKKECGSNIFSKTTFVPNFIEIGVFPCKSNKIRNLCFVNVVKIILSRVRKRIHRHSELMSRERSPSGNDFKGAKSFVRSTWYPARGTTVSTLSIRQQLPRNVTMLHDEIYGWPDRGGAWFLLLLLYGCSRGFRIIQRSSTLRTIRTMFQSLERKRDATSRDVSIKRTTRLVTRSRAERQQEISHWIIRRSVAKDPDSPTVIFLPNVRRRINPRFTLGKRYGDRLLRNSVYSARV